jgi:hypothetical protein
MIHENVMAQGSFEIPLALDAPYSLWTSCVRFGHIIVTPQYINPAEFNDAALLGFSRYTGVVLEKKIDEQGIKLIGSSLHWHLGDDANAGPVLEGTTSFSSSTLTSVFSTALADTGLSSGTINTSGLGSYTGVHYYATPAEIIRTACLTVGAEYRVNPDGTVDAGAKANVYTITNPVVVVSRRHWGSDPSFKSVPVESMRTHENARDYAERVVVTANNNNDVPSLIDSLNRSPAGGYVNLAGDPLIRTYVGNIGISNPISVGTWALSQLNQRSIEQRQDISTEHYEITGGSFFVGDAFYAWDPPAFQDDNNPQYFRGEVIFPITSRLLAADWPLRRGMGVMYRAANGTYTDLAQYVAWEGETIVDDRGSGND